MNHTQTIHRDCSNTGHRKASTTRGKDSTTPKMPLVGYEMVLERGLEFRGPGVKNPCSIRHKRRSECRMAAIPLIGGRRREHTERGVDGACRVVICALRRAKSA